MVVISPPPKEVAQDSSFTTQGDYFTPKQLEIIRELQLLAGDPPKVLTSKDVRKASKERKCSSVATIQEYFESFTNALRAARLPMWKDDPSACEQALAQYLSLKNKLERTPDAIRHADICAWYDIDDGTLSVWIRKGEVRVLKRIGRGVVFVSHYDTLKNLRKLPDRLITPRKAALRYGISYNTIQTRIRGDLLRLEIEPPSPGHKESTRQIHEGEVREYVLQRIEKGEAIEISIETSSLSKRRQRANAERVCILCGSKGKVHKNRATGKLICKICTDRRRIPILEVCASCGRSRTVAKRIEGGRPLCQTCYRQRNPGKSRPEYGICSWCHKGPQLISYRHPVTRGNACKKCYTTFRPIRPRRKKPTISA